MLRSAAAWHGVAGLLANLMNIKRESISQIQTQLIVDQSDASEQDPTISSGVYMVLVHRRLVLHHIN